MHCFNDAYFVVATMDSLGADRCFPLHKANYNNNMTSSWSGGDDDGGKKRATCVQKGGGTAGAACRKY